jgi:hypothetical protein
MTIQAIGIFCEDIREEKSGQFTLVGLLPDNIVITGPPANQPPSDILHQAIIPKLGLYVRIHMDPTDDPGPIAVSLTLPNETRLDIGNISDEVVKTSKQQARDNGLSIAGILHHAVIQGFVIAQAGKIRAILEMKGQEHTCAILNVIQQTVM